MPKRKHPYYHRTVLTLPDKMHPLWEHLYKNTRPMNRRPLQSVNGLILAAVEMVFSLGGPEELQKRVMGQYGGVRGYLGKGQKYHTPAELDGTKKKYTFTDLLEIELKRNTLQELQDKWDLTREELASLLFWHVVINNTP